jgi:hypothetical protein
MQSNAELRCQLERFQDFQKDFIQCKVIEKYNKLRKIVMQYINRDNDLNYIINYYNGEQDNIFFTPTEEYLIIINICIKKLSRERIINIWEKLFPEKDILTILDLYDEDFDGSYVVGGDHVILGVEHDSPNECDKLEILHKKFTYEEDDIFKLLNELSMIEVAKIVPRIDEITYVSI